jgi:hypothetical protein
MKRLVQDMHCDGILYAEARVVGFYRLFGFAMYPDDIRGSHSCPPKMWRVQSALKGAAVVDLASPPSKGVLAQSGEPPVEGRHIGFETKEGGETRKEENRGNLVHFFFKKKASKGYTMTYFKLLNKL